MQGTSQYLHVQAAFRLVHGDFDQASLGRFQLTWRSPLLDRLVRMYAVAGDKDEGCGVSNRLGTTGNQQLMSRVMRVLASTLSA